MNRVLLFLLTSSLALLVTAVLPPAGAGDAQASAAAAQNGAGASDDVIARVGDQPITFQDINTALNSSAIVGVSVPALGTPQRDRVRIMLLDRFISANLLYLDAVGQGLDQDPAYRRDVQRFDDAILAGLYQRQLLGAADTVSDADIQASFKKNAKPGAELTDDLRAAIEATLRHDQVREHEADIRGQIRDSVEIVVHDDNLSPAGDASRPDTAVLAEIDGEPLTWGAVGERITAAGKGALSRDAFADEEDARRQALDREIDLRIMAAKARAAGLDQDRRFLARSREFHKTRLINLHRERLLAGLAPSDAELKAFYEANEARLVQPETRKIQMVVVKTKEEAEALKADIEADALSLYQAAQQHSIAAGAKENLGEVGWVNRGDTVAALDEAIFALAPNEISAPVQTPAGWHLVSVQDMLEARYTDFTDPGTRRLALREYLNDRLNAYLVGLRRNDFAVQVYPKVLVDLAQREADMVKALAEKAAQPGSVTEQRVKALSELMRP